MYLCCAEYHSIFIACCADRMKKQCSSYRVVLSVDDLTVL